MSTLLVAFYPGIRPPPRIIDRAPGPRRPGPQSRRSKVETLLPPP